MKMMAWISCVTRFHNHDGCAVTRTTSKFQYPCGSSYYHAAGVVHGDVDEDDGQDNAAEDYMYLILLPLLLLLPLRLLLLLLLLLLLRLLLFV